MEKQSRSQAQLTVEMLNRAKEVLLKQTAIEPDVFYIVSTKQLEKIRQLARERNMTEVEVYVQLWHLWAK